MDAGAKEKADAVPAESAHLPRQKWTLTQDAFDRLLASLCSDRDIAAGRYLEIRRNLVRLFEWRGCSTPDEYADETLRMRALRIRERLQLCAENCMQRMEGQ
jgi:hypothetical protein